MSHAKYAVKKLDKATRPSSREDAAIANLPCEVEDLNTPIIHGEFCDLA